MPRRARSVKRTPKPDYKYGNETLAKFINKVMERGKRSTAESIVYGALDIVGKETKKSPIEVFEQAMKNATPILEVRPRRVGGATYQVPVEIRVERRNALAIRWLINAASSRKGKPMAEKLASEFMDAAQGQGSTIKKKQDTHAMAEANKAFVHYRW